jgi:Spy/CpxP family protein refolding chaperone
MFRGKLPGCLLAGLFGAVMIGGAGLATAGEPPMESPLGRLIAGVVGHYLVFRSEFSLTHQQREDIHQAIRQHKAEIGKAVVEVWEKRNTLRDDVLAGKDEQTVRKAADELGKAIGDAAVACLKVRNQIDPVLTDQQRSLIKKFIQDTDADVARFFKEVSRHEAAPGHEKAERAEKAERREKVERREKAPRVREKARPEREK